MSDERIDPMLIEAYRIGVKQLGEDEFIARVESTITAIQAMPKERHADDPQGMVISLVALHQALGRDVAGLRGRIAAWAGLDKKAN